MELIFEPRAWQSQDGQGTWFFKTEVWGQKHPGALTEYLGSIEEGEDDADSWAVSLNGSDLDGQEYIGIAAAQQAIRDYYAAKESTAGQPPA